MMAELQINCYLITYHSLQQTRTRSLCAGCLCDAAGCVAIRHGLVLIICKPPLVFDSLGCEEESSPWQLPIPRGIQAFRGAGGDAAPRTNAAVSRSKPAKHRRRRSFNYWDSAQAEAGRASRPQAPTCRRRRYGGAGAGPSPVESLKEKENRQSVVIVVGGNVSEMGR
jgi:hypothetical protein